MKLSVLLLIGLLAGCSTMNDETARLVGIWELTEQSEPGRIVTTLTLNTDHSCELKSQFLDINEEKTSRGTFMVSGDALNLDLGEDGKFTRTIISATQSELTLKQNSIVRFQRKERPQPIGAP